MKKMVLTGAILSALTFSSISVNAEEASKYIGNHEHERAHYPQHHHGHHHNNKHHKLLNKHKKEVVHYLANYLNQPEANVNQIANKHKLEMKKLIFVAVVAKLANKPLENVIAAKKENKSFKDLLNNYNINRDQFFGEMKKVHRDIFTQIEPSKN